MCVCKGFLKHQVMALPRPCCKHEGASSQQAADHSLHSQHNSLNISYPSSRAPPIPHIFWDRVSRLPSARSECTLVAATRQGAAATRAAGSAGSHPSCQTAFPQKGALEKPETHKMRWLRELPLFFMWKRGKVQAKSLYCRKTPTIYC